MTSELPDHSDRPVPVDRWLVGPEYDEAIRARLKGVLLSAGYEICGNTWAVGGSQESSQWSAAGPAGPLLIEAETYVGLTVCGNTRAVERLRRIWESTSGC